MLKPRLKIIFPPFISIISLAILLLWLKPAPVTSLTNSTPFYWIENELVITGNATDHSAIISAIPYVTAVDSITLTLPTTTTYIRRYQISQFGNTTPTVRDAIQEITILTTTTAVAEPNAIMATSTNRYVWGSPWTSPTTDLPLAALSNTWVKEAIDLEISAQRTITTTGAGISVYVIDTSPFTYPTNSDASYANIMPNTTPISVWHTVDITSPVMTNPPHGGHGTMAASIINMVAPDAQVHLFRALTSEGYGDLFTLNKVFNQVLQHAATQPNTPAVINMSLGTIDNSETITQIHSLSLLLTTAYDAGYPLVGSSGNFSTIDGDGFADVAPMQYPAAFTNVLAVAATNILNNRACFSSESADVAAPGGEGTNLCTPPPSCGTDNANCVVGWDPTSSTNVAGGQGTSFAAPLVAGQAALLLEYANTQANVSDIYCAIKKSAIYQETQYQLGYGYVNIFESHRLLEQIIRFGSPTCPTIPLTIHKEGPSEVAYGGTITYTIIVTNEDTTAHDIIIRDRLPTNATYLTGGEALVEADVTWTVTNVLPNTSRQLQFAVQATTTITNNNYQAWAYGGMAWGQTAVSTTVWHPLRPTATITATTLTFTLPHIGPHIIYTLWESDRVPFSPSDVNTTLVATQTISNTPLGSSIPFTHTTHNMPRYYIIQAVSGAGTGTTAVSAPIGTFPFTLQTSP